MLMTKKGPDLYGVHDNDINRVVQDYRSGRIDDETFREKVTAWKQNWHRRIADLVPGHTLEVLVDANSRMPLFRLNPKPDVPAADDNKIPQHLQTQKVRAKSRGPSR